MTTVAAEAVLFDLDGTLVDSAADLYAAMNHLCAEHGHPPPEFARFRGLVSQGARAMLALAFPDLEREAREAHLPRFLEIYAAAVLDHSTPFDGIEAVLAHIEDNGRRWGIVTNKPEYLARAVVQGMGWQQRCAVLVGGDTLAVKKPDPAPLTHACAQMGVEPQRCVYVGDDRRDVEAPRAIGMKAVVALWGYREADDDPHSWMGDAYAELPVQLLRPGMLSPLP